MATRRGTAVLLATAANCILGAPAFAQAAQQADAASADIVVTAQRRTERLQDVPISASVIGGAELQQRNTSTLESLSAQTPAVVVTKGGAGNRLSIRGIGSGDNNPLFEQSVATFVDGIYQGRSRSSGAAFLDLLRVEILKGPQSVYFGNNAIAGVLNLVSRDPGEAPDGYLRSAYNFSFDSATVEGAFGGPVSDTLGIRLAGTATRGDGYIRDETIGIRIPRVRSYAGRATIKWEPTQNLSWAIKASAEHLRQTGAISDEIAYCPPNPLFTGGATGSCLAALGLAEDVVVNQRRSHSRGQGIDTDAYALSSNLNYDAGPLQLSLLTGYARTKYDQRLDSDGTSATLAHFTTPERFTQFSQEFRIATPRGDVVAFDAGLYYQRERIHGGVNYNFAALNPRLTGRFAALAPIGNYGAFDDYVQKSQTMAAYLFFTVRPAKAVTLSFGGRQNWVDKSIVLNQGFGYSPGVFGSISPYPTVALQQIGDAFGLAAGLGVTGTRKSRRSDEHFSPSIVLSYEPSSELNIYAKYTNGFKGGGFNGLEHTGSTLALTFGPEYVDGYELGLKLQLFNRRLTVNVALFRNDFDNLQVSTSQNFGAGVVNSIGNAGGARAKGLELESRLRLGRGFSTGLSFTLLDSKYTSYPLAGGSALDVQQGRPFVDLSGARTRYAPRYSGNYDLDYIRSLGAGLKLHLNGSMFFTSAYNFSNNNDPFLSQGKYARLGAIVGIGDESDRWEVSVIGKNLTDRTVRIFGTNLAQSRGSYLIGTDEPLNVTLQARVNF
nr:TonB-dependent receptor [Sphingobium sp. SCG-1]